MKKNKLMLLMALIVLSLSCKKNEILQKDINPTNLNKNAKLQGSNFDSYEVGGTIGCAIRLTDPSSSEYGNNDAYDSCMDDMLSGTRVLNGGNNPSPPKAPPAPECLPCMAARDATEELMAYFWELLNITEPQTLQEYNIAKAKIAVYNVVIVSVFTNSNGELEIPEDRTERKNMLLTYNGILPDGIVDYVDFAYGKYFAIKSQVASSLFESIDSNGIIHQNSYGIKTII